MLIGVAWIGNMTYFSRCCSMQQPRRGQPMLDAEPMADRGELATWQSLLFDRTLSPSGWICPARRISDKVSASIE